MYRDFIFTRCSYCDDLIMICKGDYPFCDKAMVIVEKGLDTSTYPDERFRRTRDIMAEMDS